MSWGHTSTMHVMPENIMFLFFQIKFLHLLVTNLHTIRVFLQCSSVHKIIVLSKPFFSVFSLFSFSLPIFYNIT